VTGGRLRRNLAIQGFILASMVGVAIVNEDLYIAAIAVSLLILPPINWSVAGVLIWTSRQDPSVRSLADAAENAMTWAVSSTVAALIGALVLGRLMGFVPNQIGSVITVLLGFVVVTGSMPAVRFLRTWREVWLPLVRMEQLPGNYRATRMGDTEPRGVVDVDDVVPAAGAPVDQGDPDAVDVDRSAPPMPEGSS